MPLPKEQHYTSKDYWDLPEGKRAELIDGQLYAMAPPNFKHQKLVSEFTQIIGDHIKAHHGTCEVIPAPFAVDLGANDQTWVEPDVSVICDPDKITERGCSGAPDLIVEIVSPSSRKNDYATKNALYLDAGVREYWIVDPMKERITVYHYEKDAAPAIYPFDAPIEVAIFPGLFITIAERLKNGI